MTLIEVVAGTVLMVLLMTQLLAISREHTRQMHAAERKETAVREMETLLADWFRNPELIPRQGEGVLAGLALRWKTSVVLRKIDPRLGADVLCVSLHDANNAAAPPLTACEVLIPALAPPDPS